MHRAYLVIAIELLCAPAQAKAPLNPPLPPPRPNFEKAIVAPEPPPTPTSTPTPPTPEASICPALQDGRIIGASLPAIPGENGCGLAAPVRVTGVKLRTGAKLRLTPDAILNCEMASEVVDFLDDEVARIEKAGEGKIVEVQQAGAYECRGRNRVPGAKLSEHASGNAIDLRAFKFANGKSIVIGGESSRTWVGVKGAACARFKTVLGPGSDAAHKDNLHLDLRSRKSSTICQWAVD